MADRVALDLRALLRRLNGDEQLLAVVARLFLEDCPKRVAAVEEATASGNAKDIRFAAHALRGVAGNLCATDLEEAAIRLERRASSDTSEGLADASRQVVSEAKRAMACLRSYEASPHDDTPGDLS